MYEAMLTLRTGVSLTEQDGQVGLTLHGRTQFAKDERQTEIAQVLVKQPQSLESMMALLRTLDNPPKNDNDISLAIAEFILDFGEYLKA